MKYVGILAALSWSLALSAHAEPWRVHTRNQFVAEQVQLERSLFPNQRAFPHSDHYSIALDVTLFGHTTIPPVVDFYHGPGLWVAPFLEFRPIEDLHLNLKPVLFAPSASYGFGGSGAFPFLSFYWSPALILPPEWKMGLRVMDLDRQTVGAGLLISEKEMAGVLFENQVGVLRHRLLVDGTGGFYASGDLAVQSIDGWDGAVGILWAILNNPPSYYTDDWQYRYTPMVHFFSLYSKKRWFDWLDAGAELSYANQRWAGMIQTEFRIDLGEGLFHARVSPSAWYYGYGYAEYIEGRAKIQNVSPETLDKPYTESRTILRQSDGVWATSLLADFEFTPLAWLRFGAAAEAYLIRSDEQRNSSVAEQGIFGKVYAGLVPYGRERRERLNLYVSNKMLNTPEDTSGAVLNGLGMNFEADRPFIDAIHVGVDVFLYF